MTDPKVAPWGTVETRLDHRRRPDLVPRRVGIDLCLYDPAANVLHVLNASAALVWQHFDSDAPPALVRRLARGLALESVSRDVQAILQEFVVKNLITPDHAVASPPDKHPDVADAAAAGAYVTPALKTFSASALQVIFDLSPPVQGVMHSFADTWGYEDIITHMMMLKDSPRTTMFERAIARLVRPGMTVMDFGCGTGILAFFASRSGAKEVTAVDRSAILPVARMLGAANGFQNIRFVQGDESSVNVSASVDVLVSECLGYFAVTEGMIDAFLRARDRFLAPGGALCPRALRFVAHLVKEPSWSAELDFFGSRPYGIDFGPVRDWPCHKALVKTFGPNDVLPWSIDLGTVDLHRVERQPSHFRGELTAPESAPVYGLAGSFDAVLADDVVLETGPFAAPTHWGQMFFPFREPFAVRAGQQVQVSMEAFPGAGGEMSWRWSIAQDARRLDMDDFIHRLWAHSGRV